jgi:hypothetical protein
VVRGKLELKLQKKKVNLVWNILDNDSKWDTLEQLFSIPVEDRLQWLIDHADRVECIGKTDKSAPELAVEFIKKGIKAKSYVKGEKK